MRTDFVVCRHADFSHGLTETLVSNSLYYHYIGKMLLVPFLQRAPFFLQFHSIVIGKVVFYKGRIQYALCTSTKFPRKILAHFMRPKIEVPHSLKILFLLFVFIVVAFLSTNVITSGHSENKSIKIKNIRVPFIWA